jgi:hypothetical protein
MSSLSEQGRGLNPTKENYINSKLNSLIQLGNEIDNIEELLVSYITLKAQYTNKELVFTDADIKSLQDKQAANKQKLAEKLAKFEKLNTKFVYARN